MVRLNENAIRVKQAIQFMNKQGNNEVTYGEIKGFTKLNRKDLNNGLFTCLQLEMIIKIEHGVNLQGEDKKDWYELL